jgi:hypothetical protein
MPGARDVAKAGAAAAHPSWLVLTYRVSSEPTRLRAAIWRRLKRARAVYLAHSVAVLPDSPAAERLLRRLRSEVRDMGGSAQVLRAEAMAGEMDVIRQINAARDHEYSQMISECTELLMDIDSQMAAGRCTLTGLGLRSKQLENLARRNGKVRGVDDFSASQAEPATAALAKCQDALGAFAEYAYRAAEPSRRSLTRPRYGR